MATTRAWQNPFPSLKIFPRYLPDTAATLFFTSTVVLVRKLHPAHVRRRRVLLSHISLSPSRMRFPRRGQCGLAFRPLTISFRSIVVRVRPIFVARRRRWNFAGTYSAYVLRLPRDIPGYYPIFTAKLLSLSIPRRKEQPDKRAPIKWQPTRNCAIG